ncbi:MAG: IS4 family transposase [Clostridium sp.]|uniref:IS4 family transposase n=1 Tax=Clostridium sp. TaxID=1506 RepID=UPI003F3C688F
MHKRLKKLIKNTNELFTDENINQLARKTGFVKRNSKLDAESFLAFNIFKSNDLCSKSLNTLCGRLAATYNINISPQALNSRFNENAVEFMKKTFLETMIKQSNVLQNQISNLAFKRIILTDATSYKLPDKLIDEYIGTGGSGSGAGIKIQLQYDILSGNFLTCDPFKGTFNDCNYLETMEQDTLKGDLRLSDLGYFKLGHLNEIHNKEAFYISKIKSTTNLYTKEPYIDKFKDNRQKDFRYKKIDILEIVKPLKHGETIELKDIYIGSKKELKNRLIITKLTEKNKSKRVKKQINDLRADRRKLNERNVAWTGVNAYITNISSDVVATDQVHEIYSLRWQIEIMFKVWKSIFNITAVKNIKKERFKCFLYGRLISLILASQIVFTAKEITNAESGKDISILKSFNLVNEYFYTVTKNIFKSELNKMSFLNSVIQTLQRLGTKSIRNGRTQVFEIIESLKISENELEKMAI